jgi:hypothetical protein
VSGTELYLFQLPSIHMAELCAGAPKIIGCEVIRLQAPRAAPNHVPDDVLGNAGSSGSSVTTHCPEYLPRRHQCGCQPSVHGTLHPRRHGNCPDVIVLADKVHDGPMSLSDLNVFIPESRQLGSA